MATVQAVLFDYGLVLSAPPDPAFWESLKQVFGAGEQEFQTVYWKHRHEYDRGDLSGAAYWRAVAADLHQAISEEQLTTLVTADVSLWAQPNPPMIAWAGRLQRAGIRTGILSNIGDAMEDGIRSRCQWLDDFSHHTFSHRLNMAKPELAIYEHAAEGLQTAPEQVLFIDDREENIAAAVLAGMQAVQYRSHDQFVANMRSNGLGRLLDV